MDKKEIVEEGKKLAEQHADWLLKKFHDWFVDGFIHGYKHGFESAGKINKKHVDPKLISEFQEFINSLIREAKGWNESSLFITALYWIKTHAKEVLANVV